MGDIPDTHIAKRLNVAASLVSKARNTLGIPPFKPYQPTEEQWSSVIWTDTNEEIGAQLGISDFRAFVYREAHGIPSNLSGHSRNRDWSKVVLGSDTDDNLGLIMGISGAAIRKRRVRYPCFQPRYVC